MDQTKRIERRRHDRVKVRWPITVLSDDGAIEGETRNVTVDGVFICCEEPLRLNEICFMSIEPPDHQMIEVAGKVIWSDFYAVDDRDSAFGTGICFVEISDGDRHFLEDVVSAHPQQ